MNAFFAWGNKRLAVEDGVDEILDQDRVRVGSVLERDFRVPHLRLGKSELCGPAEFDHVRVIAGECDFIALKDKLAASANDLESIGARRLAGGRNKGASCAIGILQVRRNVILDFDLMEKTKLAEAANATGHCD